MAVRSHLSVAEPLQPSELAGYEHELLVRTDAALREVRALTPRMVPSEGSCGRCHVRHICDGYWLWLGETAQQSAADWRRQTGMEVLLVHRPGSARWTATVVRSAVLGAGDMVAVEAPLRGLPSSGLWHAGARVRLLRVSVSPAEAAGVTAAVTLTPLSEAFTVP